MQELFVKTNINVLKFGPKGGNIRPRELFSDIDKLGFIDFIEQLRPIM